MNGTAPLKMSFYNMAKDIWTDEILLEFRDILIEETKEKAQALLCSVSEVDTKEFKNLKYILSPTTRTSHIKTYITDSPPIKIYHLNTSDFKTFAFLMEEIHSTTEHTFGLILSLLRNYPYEFQKSTYSFYRTKKGHTLFGKTLGILGYGRIGKQVQRLAKAFGMNVYVLENEKDNPCICDIVTLHLPLTVQTTKIINKDFLGRMKKGAYLINTARSGIVDEEAIFEALKNGYLSGYAADVCEIETNNITNLWYSRNSLPVIFTSHIGGYTVEDTLKTAKFLLKKFMREKFEKNNSKS